MYFTTTRKCSTYTCGAPSESAISRRQHLEKQCNKLFKWDKSVYPSHDHVFMSGCSSESRAVITLSSDGTICSLWRAAATLCPFFKAQQNIQMFAGFASSRRACIHNGIRIQRHDPKWSGGQLCGYHEKTHTSCDRTSSGTWRGVGSGFLDECFACTVEPTGRRLFFVFFCFFCLLWHRIGVSVLKDGAETNHDETNPRVKCDRENC